MANNNGTNFKTLNNGQSATLRNARYVEVLCTKSLSELTVNGISVPLIVSQGFTIIADEGNTFPLISLSCRDGGECEVFWY